MVYILRVGALVLGAVLIIAAIVMLFSQPAPKQEAPMCTSDSGCSGAPPESCPGRWACKGGSCRWECAPMQSPTAGLCEKPLDCEGLPHAECIGFWSCESNRCSWACDIDPRELDIAYEVSECDDGMPWNSSVRFQATATGIRMSQVLPYVCCAKVNLSARKEGNEIRIDEINTGEMCKCMCSYNITAEMEVLPGTYGIDVYGVEYGGIGAELLAESMVSVGKSQESVLFIEHHKVTGGRLIAGSYPKRFLHEEGYTFDAGQRALAGKISFSLDGLAAIYGSGESITGDAGSGAATKLYPVYSAPVTVGDDRITRIWEDGTIAIVHNNKTLELSPGESWNETSSVDTADKNNMGIMRVTTTDRITNYGFIKIADIVET